VVDFGRILAALVGFLINAAVKLVALWGFAVRFVQCSCVRKGPEAAKTQGRIYRHWTKRPKLSSVFNMLLRSYCFCVKILSFW
jgi:hypothetical protein